MMRATSDNAATPLAPEARELSRKVATTDDTASLFAATLGLVGVTVTKTSVDELELCTDEKKSEDATVPQASAFTGLQLVPLLPPLLAGAGGESAEKGAAVDGLKARPAPNGIDLSSFELIAPDQQVALPLEAALQQLTASFDKTAMQLPEPTGTVATAPSRVITPANEIVEVVSRHVARGEQHVTMVLRPAELGEVRVRVEHSRDNHVTIKLEAETRDATSVLRARIPELQATLAAQGVTVNSVDVSLTASDAMQQHMTGGEPSQGQHQSDREEYVDTEDATRPLKRTKRNSKDLDVVI